jgi:hypothetical protein
MASTTRGRIRLVLAAAVALPVVFVILYTVPPTESSPYPRCYFYQLTGFHCPGCGATRCLHALLHGDVCQAAAYNIVALIVLLFLALSGLRRGCALLAARPVRRRPIPAWILWLLLVLILAYWLLRNLDYPPFHFLAPHEL